VVESSVETQQPEQVLPREDFEFAALESGAERKPTKEQKYCGNQLKEMKDSLVVSHPIERGRVKNWEDLEMLW
jgi:actin-related protein